MVRRRTEEKQEQFDLKKRLDRQGIADPEEQRSGNRINFSTEEALEDCTRWEFGISWDDKGLQTEEKMVVDGPVLGVDQREASSSFWVT